MCFQMHERNWFLYIVLITFFQELISDILSSGCILMNRENMQFHVINITCFGDFRLETNPIWLWWVGDGLTFRFTGSNFWDAFEYWFFEYWFTCTCKIICPLKAGKYEIFFVSFQALLIFFLFFLVLSESILDKNI